MKKSLVKDHHLTSIGGKVKRVRNVDPTKLRVVNTDRSGFKKIGMDTYQWGNADDRCLQEEFVTFPIMYSSVPTTIAVSAGYITERTIHGFRWVRDIDSAPLTWFSLGL